MIRTMESLTASINQMDDMRQISDDLVTTLKSLGSSGNSQAYADDLELTVELHVNLVEWKNFRVCVEKAFSDDVLSQFTTAGEYRR